MITKQESRPVASEAALNLDDDSTLADESSDCTMSTEEVRAWFAETFPRYGHDLAEWVDVLAARRASDRPVRA